LWANEQETGVALRALRDEPAPPAQTSLDAVLRRGRRRVRGQRLGVLAVVVTVLAAGAGGALAVWRPDPPAESATAELGTTYYRWPEQLAGWSVVEPASCGAPSSSVTADLAAKPILQRDEVEPAFVAAVADVTGGPANLTVSSWDGSRGYTEVEVPVDKAWGSVQLEETRELGQQPTAAADADVGVYGFCTAPMRRILDGGTVLQLYAPDSRSPFAPVQHLRTYLPSGLQYVVTSAGWSRADDQGGVVRTGRGRLPLDSEQLAEIAVRIAQLE
jgi:hypothetical protein